MTDSTSSSWPAELFGSPSEDIRKDVFDLVKGCHERLSDSQDASGMRTRGVYGQIWRATLEDFEFALMKYPGAQQITPKGANYRVVAIGDTVIFPWRFAKDLSQSLQDTRFAVSDARLALFSLPFSEPPAELDLGLYASGSELSPDDETTVVESDLRTLLDSFRVVVVGFSSQPGRLHTVEWGEAMLGDEGYLVWAEHEQLMDSKATIQESMEEPQAFDEGPVPPVFVIRKEDDVVSNG